MANLRVLLVTPWFAPHIGGIENHVQQVAARLGKRGFDVTVLTADPTGMLPKNEIVESVSVQRANAYPRGRDWMLAPAMRRVISSGDWDVVHLQGYQTLVGPLTMASAARARVPCVVTFHGGGSLSGLRQRFRSIQMKALAPLFRRAAALVATADFEITDYGRDLKIAPRKFVKIPNGSDLPDGVRPIESDGRLIVSLGRLERYKGHHLAVQALPHLREVDPTARLWLAGDGPERDHLVQLAAELGVGDHVEVGAVDRPTLAGRLSGASLAVALSNFETHPMAVLEAASLGVPVLVADNSGLSELAAQGIATAVPLGLSPAEYGEAMVRAMSAAHSIPPGLLWTWDQCADALAELYVNIALAGGSPHKRRRRSASVG
jgi:glycosyltransferase involved in cell wall biosynthesis